MPGKAKVEEFEVIGNHTITRFFKAGSWSYSLIDADGTEVGSVWLLFKPSDAWASKGGPGPKFRAPITGEPAVVDFLRTLALLGVMTA